MYIFFLHRIINIPYESKFRLTYLFHLIVLVFLKKEYLNVCNRGFHVCVVIWEFMISPMSSVFLDCSN